MSKPALGLFDGLNRLGGAVLSGGTSELFPNNPVIGRNGVLGRIGGAIATGGFSELGRLTPPAPGIPEKDIPSPGPPPTPDDPETAAKLAAAEAAERKKRRRAQASLLTSPQGVPGEATTSVKTLLGGQSVAFGG